MEREGEAGLWNTFQEEEWLEMLADPEGELWPTEVEIAEKATKFLLRPEGFRALEDRLLKVRASEDLKRWCTVLRWADDKFNDPCGCSTAPRGQEVLKRPSK